MSELADQLRQDVESLCLPQGRVAGSAGHEAARRLLTTRFERLGLSAYRGNSFDLPYARGGLEFHNLAAVAPGGQSDSAPVVIGAHYDSILAAPAADDNAAALAIALAAAERLQRRSLPRDVAIVLFDAEEPPYHMTPAMGSIAFYEEQLDSRGVHAAAIMDLVGHDVPLGEAGLGSVESSLAGLLFITGAESHPGLAEVLRNCLRDSLPLIATHNSNIGKTGPGDAEGRTVSDLSDQYVFRVHGDPYLFLTCGHWEHYHKATDTPEKLNYEKMARICEFLVDLTEGLARAPLAPPKRTGGAVELVEADTVDLEVELLTRVFGPLLPALLMILGLDNLETREDLDALARQVQGFFHI